MFVDCVRDPDSVAIPARRAIADCGDAPTVDRVAPSYHESSPPSGRQATDVLTRSGHDPDTGSAGSSSNGITHSATTRTAAAAQLVHAHLSPAPAAKDTDRLATHSGGAAPRARETVIVNGLQGARSWLAGS